MNIIKIISESQLSKLLLCISGTKEVSITTETVVKMNKTNNPYFGKVRKQTKTSALINFDYESSVNRGLQKRVKTRTSRPRAERGVYTFPARRCCCTRTSCTFRN